MNKLLNDIPRGRARLRDLLRSSGDVITITDAVEKFNLDRKDASKLLSRWAKQGWLRRVGSGRYVSVSIKAQSPDVQVIEDPWVIVPALFSPCYIGGRTAAEYWDLTEQIFRDIIVLTSQTVQAKKQEHNGIIFSLSHIQEKQIFGTKIVWRRNTKILVSDIHRTIIDMMNEPKLGGGIQHTNDCFLNYLNRRDRDLDKLIEYADKLGNGAIFKRLGYLAEEASAPKKFINACNKRLTKGNAKLDPSLLCERIITKWKICVPKNWNNGLNNDRS